MTLCKHGVHLAGLLLLIAACSEEHSSSAVDDDPKDSAQGEEAICGNGDLDVKEDCDDGNTTSNDGCSEKCEIEDGYACGIPGEPCNSVDECVDVEYIPRTPIAWLEAQQSRFTAKALVTSIGSGIIGANLYSVVDYDFPWKLPTHYLPGGTYGWCGFIDVTFWAGTNPGDPKPVYYTVTELMKYIRPYDNVTIHSVDLPDRTTIHRYDFTKTDSNHTVSMVWYDDRIGQLPGDDMPEVEYEFVKPGYSYLTKMDMIIGPNQTEFRPKPIAAVGDGVFNLTVTETPSLLLVNHTREPEGRIEFKLGMEYTRNSNKNSDGKNLAEIYRDMGATLTKPIDGTTHMGSIQTNCSTGKYDFSGVDDLVKEWQAAGYEFLIALSMSWDDQKPSEFTPTQESCYRDYVRTFVERYDLDGVDDMPGLLEPIRYWQIESEFRTGFFDIAAGENEWDHPGEEYVRILEIAHDVIKGEGGAYPDALIVTIPGQFRGIYRGFESEHWNYEDYDSLDLPAGAQKTLDSVKVFLSRPELFDVVSYNNIADWSHTIGAAKFLNGVMNEYGYSKPIIMSDMSYTVDPMLCIGMCMYPYDGISVNIFDQGQYLDVVAFLDSLGPNAPFEGIPETQPCN